MPTYEYKCDACGFAFEKFQSMSAAPVKKCPNCGKNKVKRLISVGAGIIFKGGGFYETDYRSDSYKKAAEADKNPGNSGGSGELKSETKADAKTDATPATKNESSAKTESPKPAKSADAKPGKGKSKS